MKRTIPLVLGIVVGLVALADFFIANPVLDSVGATVVDWVAIVGAFALILGTLNVAWTHLSRLIHGGAGWPYSFCLLAVLVVVVASGVAPGSAGPADPIVAWVFDYIYTPLSASVFALLAFFVASAAYRSLRLRTPEAALMTVAAVVVLLASFPVGPLANPIWDLLPSVRDWIVAYPMTAGLRGIILGVSIGVIALGFRVLIGAERQHLE